MLYIALSLMALVLLKIAQEDWKDRSVHFYWFLALFGLLTWICISKIGVSDYLMQYLINTGFVLLQLLLVNLYFCVKHKRILWIFDQYLGWGDVVFLLAIAGAWNFVGFFVFFIGSLILILIFAVLYLQRRKQSIPLAGLQALLFLGCYLLNYFNLLSMEGILPYYP